MRKPKPAGAMTNEDEDIIDIYYCEMCQDSGCLECASEQDKANVELPTIIAKQDERIKSLKAKLRAQAGVIEEIKSIMRTYREQESRPQGIDTPGGLEHMGDVWRLLIKWDKALSRLPDGDGKARTEGA